jgi:drug/metabolite transporter (DMT)-like permease
VVTRLPNSTASRSALISALLAIYIIWGSTYLAIRFAVASIPPFLMIGTRFALAGVLMYAALRLWKPAAAPTRNQWINSTVLGTLMLGIGTGCVAWAEQTVPSGLAALLVATTPVFMVLLDWLWKGGERPSAMIVSGVVLGLVGVVVLADPFAAIGGNGVSLAGVGAVLLASLSWSIGSLHGRDADVPKDPFLATAMQMLTGGVVLIVASVLMGETRGFDLRAVTSASLAAWGYLIVLGSFIAFSAYVYLMRNATAATVSTYAYVNPVVAVILGWWLGNEVLSSRMFVAMAILVTAVVLITRGRIQSTRTRTVVSKGADPACVTGAIRLDDATA